MGIVASCAGSFAASCCTNMCCKAISGGEGKPSGSRVPYMALFFVFVMLCTFVRYWKGLTINLFITSLRACDSEKCVGYAAVYRLSFAVCVFFLILAIVCFASSHARQVDAQFWLIKIILLIGFLIGSWFIPNDFYEGYSHICRGVGGIFLFLQIVLLLDWVHKLQETWISRDWKKAIVGVSLFCLISSGVLLGLFVHWFTNSNDGSQQCDAEKTVISLTAIFTTVFVGLSVSPLSRHGILPASILCLYCYYLAFSALSDNYAEGASVCNRLGSASTFSVITGLVITTLSVTYASYNLASNADNITSSEDGGSAEEDHKAHFAAVGGVGDNAEGSASGAGSSGNGSAKTSVPLSPPQHYGSHHEGSGVSNQSKSASDMEEAFVHVEETQELTEMDMKRLGKFHLVLACACMYTAMLLTEWGSIKAAADELPDSSHSVYAASFWVKIVTQWVTALLYIWTFLAPRCCPGRDFD